MLTPLVLFILAAPPLPKECEQPPIREVAPIKELANLDGAFSAGLDAVATWCFDSAGTWNAGVLGKPKKPVAPDAPPQGDCLKAIASCEGTFETVKNKAPLRELAANALLDFDRPYRGAKYVPKRSGLKEAPSQAADCRSKSRTELFAMAQQRMDIARLSSTVLNEYANYKTWLFARGLECRNEVAAAPKKDPTKTGLSIDTNVEPAPTLAPKDPETVAALKAPMVDKWKYFSKLQAKAEADRDFTLGFLASRELRTCDCTRVNPAAVVRALEKKEGGAAGVSLLTSEDPANTRCAVCMFEVFPLWSARSQKLCSSLDTMNDADLAKLEKSDDANGLPPRCLEETKTKRAELARAKAAADAKVVADAKAAADAKALATAKPMPAGKDGGGAAVAAAPVAANPKVGANPNVAANPAVGGNPNVAANPNANPTVAANQGVAGNPNLAANPNAAANPTVGGNPNAAAVPNAADAGAAVAGANPNLQTVDGYTYYRPPAPNTGSNPAVAANPSIGGAARPDAGPAAAAAAPPLTGGAPIANTLTGPGVPTGPLGYVAPSTWAPIPQREDGRIYVRLFMSSSCVAEIEPGPMQARTGDLLLLPFQAKALQVKSPCGGLAEVYFGREARPRVSENFGGNRPLKFEFKPQ